MKDKMIDKRVLVGFPSEVYDDVKQAASKHYQSVSAFIRETVLSRLDDEFSPEERGMIAQSLQESRRSEGVSWGDIKRDV